MMKTRQRQPEEKGAVLVTTLIVLTVLAVVAVAFMQSSSMDQLASRSVSGAYQAQLIAESAVGVARGNLSSLFARYPDSITVWQNIGGAQTNEATVLYFRANATNTSTNARPSQFGADVAILAQPLVSRTNTNPLTLAALSNALPYTSSSRDMVNLNATNASRSNAFIGLRSMTNPGAPVAAADWIYIGRNPGPTNTTNPPIGRFAYWIEDESFKVNVNVASAGARGTNSPGLSPSEARIDGSWGSSTNSAVSNANFATIVSDRAGFGGAGFPSAATAAQAAGLSSLAAADEVRFLTTAHSAGLDLSRGGFKRFNINSILSSDKRSGINRFITVITNSNSVPLFGQRFYRLGNNVAAINATNAVQTMSNVANVNATYLGTNHAHIYLLKLAANVFDYLDADSQPTVIGIETNAALISQATNWSLQTNRPSYGFEPMGGGLDGTNPVAVFGVENLPRLQEYAIHLRVRSMQWNTSDPNSFGFVTNTNNGGVATPPPTIPTSAQFEVWLDHYFEFWNPGNKDITLTNAFLKIYDMPRWGTNVTSSGNPAKFVQDNWETGEIPVNGVTFPAGRVTVLTTAPASPSPGSVNIGDFAGGNALIASANAANVVSLPVQAEDRIFRGTTRDIIRASGSSYLYTNQGIGPDFRYTHLFDLTMRGRAGSSGLTDYQSAMVLGNNDGVLESFVGLPIGNLGGNFPFQATVNNGFILDGMEHRPGGGFGAGNNDNLRGGSLLGNQNATTRPSPFEGDPRALNEQLEILLNTNSGTAFYTNIARFFNTIGPTSASSPGVNLANSSVGAPNANYVFPDRWTDVSSTTAGAATAPLVIRDAPMQTIGELGHITDPARPYYTAGAVPLLARGGGRTLRVGQPEFSLSSGGGISWYTGTNQTNASRTWTSWRLADIFTVIAPNSYPTNSATNGVPNAINVRIPGLINPNGALRDNGAALRAALFGFAFLPTPDGSPGIANRPVAISNIVSNVVSRLTNGNAAGFGAATLNPFWERGEVSELTVFNSASVGTLVSGQIMSNAFDRGREELIRRSIEMLTTRGSVYTIYAVGQSLRVTPTSTNITGTVRLKSTVELSPQFTSLAATNDAFNPGSAAGLNQRFSPPTNYATRVISTTID